MNNTMKNLKDEIGGIIKDNAFPYDGEGWGWRIPGTDIEIIAEALTSLIEQEKERAVREFGKWFDGGSGQFDGKVEQYLAERKDELQRTI